MRDLQTFGREFSLQTRRPAAIAFQVGGNLSSLGLGCSRIGSFGSGLSRRDGEGLVRKALDLGINVIDTANIYGQGDSERAIGQALKGRRDGVFLITKAGQQFSLSMRLLRPAKPIVRWLGVQRGRGASITARRAGVMRHDWNPSRLSASLDASLRRLTTPYVDAFLLHGPEPHTITDPVVVETLRILRTSGKTRHVGISVEDEASLNAALSVHDYTILEVPYTLLETRTLAGAQRDRGLIVVAREVIKMQPSVPAIEAVRNSVIHPLVTSTLVGTVNASHLADLVDQVAVHEV